MYWLFAAGFSGVCARESKSSGAENRNKTPNNRRVIFIRKRILTLTIGVIGEQHPFARAQDKAAPLQRQRQRPAYFFSSSCSSCRTAAAATESSSSSRSRRTPWVERPASRISFEWTRIT